MRSRPIKLHVFNGYRLLIGEYLLAQPKGIAFNFVSRREHDSDGTNLNLCHLLIKAA